MTHPDNIPELKEVIGAMLFASKTPLNIRDIRNTLLQSAENFGGVTKAYSEIKDAEIKKTVESLRNELQKNNLGLSISEVANGYRLQNDLRCGPWLRQLLDRGKPAKLSKPALETLAVIAYRQPCARSEIESVRGVSVDAIVRSLMELQLIKVVGRSELPGKPWLFGTTQAFLEHFGLKNIRELPGMEELKRREEARDIAEESSNAEKNEEQGTLEV